MRFFMRALMLALLLPLLWVGPAAAFSDEQRLADPALESRARDISAGLRCLVCQNQSILESNAELARDLRMLVRERVAAGDTNDEARAFIVARYGDWVLLKPPFKPYTYLLWFGPLFLLVAAAVGVFFYFRRNNRAGLSPPPALTAEEQARFERLFGDTPGTERN